MSWIPFAGAGVGLVVLAVVIVLGYWRGWRWAGLAATSTEKAAGKDVQPAKTLWDWLQLLVIPLALAGLAFLLNTSQSNRDQQREDQRAASQRAAAADAAREEALRGYLTQMSGFMLDRKLLQSRLGGPGRDVSAVARTVTLTTLRRLDGERKGVVIRFLAESRLVDSADFKLELNGANLRSADLRLAPLRETWLRGVDLRGAFLAGAQIHLTDLRGADLRGPDLRVLGGDQVPRLQGAVLSEAKYDSTTRWPAGFDPVAAGAEKVRE